MTLKWIVISLLALGMNTAFAKVAGWEVGRCFTSPDTTDSTTSGTSCLLGTLLAQLGMAD